jgi:hypothetical protein
MRGLIIDHARERHAQKHGGLFEITSLDTEAMENALDHRELVRISETLDELGKVEPALAEIVDLKFFCGFTFGEIAALKGTSEPTAQRQWEKARIYLHRKITRNWNSPHMVGHVLASTPSKKWIIPGKCRSRNRSVTPTRSAEVFSPRWQLRVGRRVM